MHTLRKQTLEEGGATVDTEAGCTHWCGSLHRHLFSCCSYTCTVGAAQSIVNLALST